MGSPIRIFITDGAEREVSSLLQNSRVATISVPSTRIIDKSLRHGLNIRQVIRGRSRSKCALAVPRVDRYFRRTIGLIQGSG